MNKGIRIGLTAAKSCCRITVIVVVLAGRAFDASAQTVTSLHSFVGSPSDGANPATALVQGNDGNFYGMTTGGGTNNMGTVFRISPSGAYTNLYSFAGSPDDGATPYAGLVQGSDGNFYGTTSEGGKNSDGIVFRISLSGSYTNLRSFAGSPNDGATPYAGLLQGNDGSFYGTTSAGGSSTNCNSGCGTVFRISSSGAYTTLYSFVSSPSDGASPYAALVQGSDGNFYGTAYTGGTNNGGIVFRISPTGTYTNLHSFIGSPADGYDPEAALVQGSDGNFYGATQYGGTNNDGIVFRISPTGTYTNLHNFIGHPTDGYDPEAALVQGSDGNFYGTTGGGGTNDDGTVFQIGPTGSSTTLYSFVGSPTDGNYPVAKLVQGIDGNFYGTTFLGGTNNNGTVFRFSVPLNPPPWPINQITGVHAAVTNIIFNIPAIAGETYQLQSRNSLTSGNWSNVPGVSVTNCIGALLTVTNSGGAVGPQGFYRFAITP